MIAIMKQHGRTIIYCMAAVFVLGIAFHIRSGSDIGFIQIAYAKAEQGMTKTDVTDYTDALAVKALAARKNPKITYAYSKALPKNTVNLNQMFAAVDADGASVDVEITDVTDSRGESLLYRTAEERKKNIRLCDTKKFMFPSVGVYTVNVRAIDQEKKTADGQYKLPVTSN